MSAFEVVVTPTRIQNARQITAAREPTMVVLAPFSAKSIVTFEEVPVTKTARRFLTIQNPSEFELQVKVTKCVSPECNLSMEWTSNVIPASGTTSMELTWSPKCVIAIKEVIQLTDNRGFKKDVLVILKSIDTRPASKAQKPPKKSSVAPVNKPYRNQRLHILPKKTKIKSPVHRRSLSADATPQRIQNRRQTAFEFEVDVVSSKRPLGIHQHTHGTPTNVFNFGAGLTVATGKENCSPTTPINASALFDQINFTPMASVRAAARPATETVEENIRNLAAMPTPNQSHTTLLANFSINEEDLRRRSFENQITITMSQTPVRTRQQETHNISLLCRMDTPQEAAGTMVLFEDSPQFFDPNLYSTSRKSYPPSDDDPIQRRRLFNENVQPPNKTFDIPARSPRSPLNRTQSMVSPSMAPSLAMIREESASPDASLQIVQQTFNITSHTAANVATDEGINLVGTPLRKKFQSMRELCEETGEQRALKFNRGSMPNLGDIEAVNPIENNRYYYQHNEKTAEIYTSTSSVASVRSTAEIQFRENEICAQSSQFNINQCHEPRSKRFTVEVDSSAKSSDVNFAIPRPAPAPRPRERTLSNRQQHPIPTIKITETTKKRHRNESETSVRKIVHKLSPPKRSKRMDSDNDSTASDSSFKSVVSSTSSGSRMRVSTWSCFQPKKFRVPIQELSLLQKQREERIVLFDAELHLQGVINPDPFAATTTCDPFLAATMYLDKQCVERHENHFKKWLNALVTVPADLDVSLHNKIDFGTLFNEVRNKEVNLAQSREAVSVTYFTKYRLDGLRRAAIKLFMSNELREPFEKLAVHIERKLISIRGDRDLHLDIVLQRDMLELLLCINPMWLRLGLEMVYGEQIFMQNNSDVFSLSSFILNRLFRDRIAETKLSKVYLRSSDYKDYMKKFTLKKILMLLVFLDTAKKYKIIEHNPCLFVKTSEFKETKAILLRFASVLLGNIGDIQRDLKRIGIVLTHRQTYLDEFDYAFRNLAVDLRDGVRLTKVMEVILMCDGLTDRLRVPAISRLQRVHNVDLALKALKEADFVITGSIAANDIADGHREKTLSLLWQIIYKFRSPKFVTAAVKLQTWWRKSWLVVCIRRRIQEKHYLRRVQAATTIQAAYRAYMARKYCRIYRNNLTTACIVIQRCVRRYLAVKRFQVAVSSAIFIQRWYRNVVITNQIRNRYLQMREAARRIQRCYRRILLARKLEKAAAVYREYKAEIKLKNYSAAIIQQQFRANYLMKRDRAAFLLKKVAIVTIQRKFKTVLLMRKDRIVYLRTLAAVSTIQTRYRATVAMKVDRVKYMALRNTSITIQRKFRAQIAMKAQRNAFLIKRNATICIQRKFRAFRDMKIERSHFMKITAATLCIQRHFKCILIMKRQKAEYITLKLVTIRIQQRCRANIACRKEHQQFLQLKQSTIRIQRYFRSFVLMKKYSQEYQRLKSATITLQTRFRGNVLMKQQRFEYLHLKKSAICIQQRYRSILLMRQNVAEYIQLKETTIFIQRKIRANWQCRIQQQQYLQLRQSVMLIQQRFRSYILMKQHVQQFKQIQKATFTIQRQFRAQLLMKSQRASYLELKTSTITIQQRYRAVVTMRKQRTEYLTLKQWTICIQRRFRANILCKQENIKYQLIKRSTLVIQRFYRGYILMKHQSNEYRRLQAAVKSIQIRFRANIQMMRYRAEYLQMRISAICIQQQYRAMQLMKVQKSKFIQLKQATITIQRRFRATRQCRQQLNKFLALKKSTIVIQRFFRGYLLMKVESTSYTQLQVATLNIQRRYRANVKMQQQRIEYLGLRQATICIQQRYRAICAARIQRSQFCQLKAAAIITQRRFRAKMSCRLHENQFQVLKLSTVKIQRYFRSYLLMKHAQQTYKQIQHATKVLQIRFRANQMMKKQQTAFICIRNSSICIQQRFRALILMRQQRMMYLQLKQTTILVQRRFRANACGQLQRHQYLLLRKSTILIQNRFRANVAGRIERNHFLLIKKATITIQGYYRGYILMKQQSQVFKSIQTAARIIQIQYRAQVVMKQTRADYLALKHSAINIQRRFRANIAMKQQRTIYITLKTSTVFIQRKFRATVLMKKERASFLCLKQSAICAQQQYRAQLQKRKHKLAFILLKSKTIYIQLLFRANKLCKIQQAEYTKLKSAAICIQQRFRANKLMQEQRRQYLLLKQCTIIIQRRFIAHKLMHVEFNSYKLQKHSAIVVQRHFRAYLQMKEDRESFKLKRELAISIQRRFRANRLMRHDQNAYKNLKNATITIQRRFRANLLMKRVQNQYKLIRCLIICIQRKYRANVAMKQHRADYLRKRNAAITIQRHLQAWNRMNIVRKQYLATRHCIMGLQCRIRGFIARRDYQAKFTPEVLAEKRRQKSAVIIQKVWRGVMVRRKQSKKLNAIRENIKKINDNVVPEDKVANRIASAIKLLKARFPMGDALRVLTELVTISRTVPQTLVQDSRFIAGFCYGIMSQAIRSEADKQLIQKCTCVILNLSRYEPTVKNIFQIGGLQTVAQMLLRWCDKEGDIFNNLCSVIYVFAQCPIMNKQIRIYMNTRDALFMLAETKKLVRRKENMRRNKAPIPNVPVLTARQKRQHPTLLPDFGLATTKLYSFHCTVFALDTVLDILQIRVEANI